MRNEQARLDLFDKEQWWEVCQECNLRMTRAQFEEKWQEYKQMKAKKRVHLRAA